MGLGQRGRFAEALMARGWPQDTPTAIVRAAGSPKMTVWSGPLRELPLVAAEGPDDSPGTIVVGDVVRVGAEIAVGLAPGASAPGAAHVSATATAGAVVRRRG
jgi:siroheme synthase